MVVHSLKKLFEFADPHSEIHTKKCIIVRKERFSFNDIENLLAEPINLHNAFSHLYHQYVIEKKEERKYNFQQYMKAYFHCQIAKYPEEHNHHHEILCVMLLDICFPFSFGGFPFMDTVFMWYVVWIGSSYHTKKYSESLLSNLYEFLSVSNESTMLNRRYIDIVHPIYSCYILLHIVLR